MQRKYNLGINKLTKTHSFVLGTMYLILGPIVLWQVIASSASSWKLGLGILMTIFGILYLTINVLGNGNNKLAPKIMIDEEEILLKPGLNSQLIKLPWRGLRYIHVNSSKLSVQLTHNNQLIDYKIRGRFSEEAIKDLKETAALNNVQFG